MTAATAESHTSAAAFRSGDRLVVIRNRRAGSRGDDEANDVLAALRTFGASVELLTCGRGAELAQLADQAVAARPAAVIAYGGDGTLNAVAARLAGTRIPFGALPGGTFNYFVRSLGFPDEPVPAARALLHARPAPHRAGMLNDHLFLINASFGLYRQVMEARERDKARFGRKRFVAFASGIATALQRHPVYDVEVIADGVRRRLRSPMLFFGVNPLQLEALSPRLAACARGGALAALALKPMSRWDMVRVGAAALAGALDESDRVETFCATEIVVTRRRPYPLGVTLDGELRKVLVPLHVRIVPDVLWVLRPPPEAAE